MTNKALLQWYAEMGVDEATADSPRNYFAAKPIPVEAPSPAAPVAPVAATTISHHTPSDAMSKARELANAARTLEELEVMVREFNGCALKKTAGKTVFADGNPKAALMIIGEAPGVEEDMQGIPFCGPSGKLLDKMIAAIGMDRTTSYITNTVFWRPPGNRQPSKEETAICLPFVEKHIALVAPRVLLLAGGVASTTLLAREDSMSRLRGKTYPYQNGYLSAPIEAIVTYHPSYLLRQPTQKRLAWADLLALKAKFSQI